MDFASIRIITDDVDRLARFYELVTGIVATRPAPVFAELRTAAGALAIASPATVAMLGQHAPKPGANTAVVIEFRVDDVDREFTRLRDCLDDVVLEPTTMPWGNRSTLFRDPDGNLVNLFAPPSHDVSAIKAIDPIAVEQR
ncbi:MAG TPA: VOC family protein [Sinomonas sp.]|nr:VOC family protein [Sinomonas sp.]